MKKTSIYQDLIYKEDRPAIKVLFDTPFTKEIRIAMKKGTVMKKHQTAFPIVIEIVDGQIDFGVEEEMHQLKKGDLVALDRSIPHDLKALEDSIIRLTLTKADETSRVEKVIEK